MEGRALIKPKPGRPEHSPAVMTLAASHHVCRVGRSQSLAHAGQENPSESSGREGPSQGRYSLSEVPRSPCSNVASLSHLQPMPAEGQLPCDGIGKWRKGCPGRTLPRARRSPRAPLPEVQLWGITLSWPSLSSRGTPGAHC